MTPFAPLLSFVKSLTPTSPGSAGVYVGRELQNQDDLGRWWSAVRLPHHPATLDPHPHVTVAYSHKGLDQGLIPDPVSAIVDPTQIMGVTTLGNAVVLELRSPALTKRWEEYGAAGTQWDYPGYRPHLTLFYLPDAQKKASGTFDPGWPAGQPPLPQFPLHFGPEVMAPLGADAFAKSLTAPGEREPWEMTRHEFESKIPVNSFDDVRHGEPVVIRGYHGTDAHSWKHIAEQGFRLPEQRPHLLQAKEAKKMVARQGEPLADQRHLLGDDDYAATTAETLAAVLSDGLTEIDPDRLRPGRRDTLFKKLIEKVQKEAATYGVETSELFFPSFVLNIKTHRLIIDQTVPAPW